MLFDPTAGFMFTLVGMISFALVLPASAVADRFGRKWAVVPAGYLECAGLALVAATSALLRCPTLPVTTRCVCPSSNNSTLFVALRTRRHI